MTFYDDLEARARELFDLEADQGFFDINPDVTLDAFDFMQLDVSDPPAPIAADGSVIIGPITPLARSVPWWLWPVLFIGVGVYLFLRR